MKTIDSDVASSNKNKIKCATKLAAKITPEICASRSLKGSEV